MFKKPNWKMFDYFEYSKFFILFKYMLRIQNNQLTNTEQSPSGLFKEL